MPKSSKTALVVAMAGVLGGFLGIMIVIALEATNNAFRTPAEMEDLTGHAVIASLPAIRSKFRRRDLVGYFIAKPSSSLAEAARNLRTSILRPSVELPPKIIMFTSSVPGEGKSTISMLAAIASQQMGKSTIIVDCDLRLSSFEKLLNVSGDKLGTLSILNGKATLEEALHEEPTTGLHVLMVRGAECAITKDRNAADILSSRKFLELLTLLAELYDVVILDTPPVLAVTDARIIATFVDSVIYVVRWNKTSRNAVLDGLKELDSVEAPIGGLVLSMVDESKVSQTIARASTISRSKFNEYYTN